MPKKESQPLSGSAAITLGTIVGIAAIVSPFLGWWATAAERGVNTTNNAAAIIKLETRAKETEEKVQDGREKRMLVENEIKHLVTRIDSMETRQEQRHTAILDAIAKAR